METNKGLKHYIVTELDGREIKKGRYKRFRISKYWQMNLRYMQGKPSMNYILAKNFLDLRERIIRADKNSIIIFDEGIEGIKKEIERLKNKTERR